MYAFSTCSGTNIIGLYYLRVLSIDIPYFPVGWYYYSNVYGIWYTHGNNKYSIALLYIATYTVHYNAYILIHVSVVIDYFWKRTSSFFHRVSYLTFLVYGYVPMLLVWVYTSSYLYSIVAFCLTKVQLPCLYICR